MKLCQYQKHDLVYAKIRGYPWWPGIIGDVKLKNVESGEKKYELLVNFIGDNSYSNLAEDKIRKFTISEGDSKIKKPKKLQMSISIASDIFNGKYTYQEWKGKDSKKGGQSSKANKQAQKETKGKKQVHFEDSSETEEEEDESAFEEESDAEEFLNGQSAEKGNRKVSSSAAKDPQKRRRGSTSMEEEFITKNKKRKTNKVIEDSEEEEKQNKAALLNSKTLNIPATNLSTSNSCSNNTSTADNSQTPFFVANSDSKNKTAVKTEEMHVIETDDDEEEEAGGAFKNHHFEHSISHMNRIQNERQTTDKLADIPASTLKNTFNQIEAVNSLILNSKISTQIPADNTQLLKLASQTSFHGDSRKNSTNLTSKKDQATISAVTTSSAKQPVGAQIIELDENKSEQEETQELDFLLNETTTQRLTRAGKLPIKKTKNPRLLKTLKTTPSLEEAANGVDLPKISQPSPQKKKRISKTPEKDTQTGDVQTNNRKFTILKKRNLDQKQTVKSGSRCQNNALDLDAEFKALFPLLQSKDPEDIPLAFNILDEIIEKIKLENPQESNVEQILGSDNGKFLSYAHMVIFNSWYISTISGNSQKYQEIRRELNDIIQLLQQLLIKKYFDHGNKLIGSMEDEKSQYEGENGIFSSLQQKQFQQKSHQQLAQIEDDGDSTRETPMSKHPIIQEETSKKGSIQQFAVNASVKQKRKSSSQKSNSDSSKQSQKQQRQEQQQSFQHQVAALNNQNNLQKSEEQAVSSFLLNNSSPFCQEMNSEGQSSVVIIKDIDFPSTPQVESNEQNKTNLELSNLTDELKVMRRKIVLKIIKSLNRILNQQALVQNYAKTIETMIRESDLSMGKKYKEACKNLITFISSSDFMTSQERIEQYINAGDPNKFNILDIKSEMIGSSKINTISLFQGIQEGNRKLSTFSTEEENIQMSSESHGVNQKEGKKDSGEINNNTCCVNEEDDDEEEIEEICQKVKEEEDHACSQNVHSQPTYNNTTTTLEKTSIANASHGHDNHTEKFQQNQQKYLSFCYMNAEEITHDNNDSNHSHEMNSNFYTSDGKITNKTDEDTRKWKKQSEDVDSPGKQSQSEQIASANTESVMCKEDQEIINGNITHQAATSVLIA